MKLAAKMLTLTVLTIACSAASAQQTASVAVIGNIVPAACTASISNGGAFKYDDIPVSELLNAHIASLPSSFATFKLSCMDPSQVSWSIVDNRPNTSYPSTGPNTGNLGLNKDSDGNPIGYYNVVMYGPFLDGKAAYLMRSVNGGENWSLVSTTYSSMSTMRPEELYSYSKSGNADTLDKGSVFSMDIIIEPTIAPLKDLTRTNDIDLDGSATINLRYL